LIIISFSLQVQITIDFNKKWNVVNYQLFSPNISSTQFSILEDILINTNQSFELFQRIYTLDTVEWTSTDRYLREDSNF